MASPASYVNEGQFIYLPSDDPLSSGNNSNYTISFQEAVDTGAKSNSVILLSIDFEVNTAPAGNVAWVYTNIVAPSQIGSNKFRVLRRLRNVVVGKFHFEESGTIPQYMYMDTNNPKTITIELADELGQPLDITGNTTALIQITPSAVE